jgi:hypothetical protein
MTIEQTVEIPVDRKLHLDFDLPFNLPSGKAKVELIVTPEAQTEGGTVIPLRSLRGIDRGVDTMEAYFERKRADKTLEDANDIHRRQESK